ncbi:hypothetical protein [Anaerotruncus sp. 1XD42-93]|nr:hypothetical protein [Anaerotruncus sp. 1XD42-93]
MVQCYYTRVMVRTMRRQGLLLSQRIKLIWRSYPYDKWLQGLLFQSFQ